MPDCARYAMRVWLDRKALAARQLTVQDVEDSLRQENVELPAGRIESLEREFTLRTDTGFRSPEDFRQLVSCCRRTRSSTTTVSRVSSNAPATRYI